MIMSMRKLLIQIFFVIFLVVPVGAYATTLGIDEKSVEIDKFDEVHRITTEIQTSVDWDINFSQLKELMFDYGTAVKVMKIYIETREEQMLLELYEEGSNNYQDAINLWSLIIELNLDNKEKPPHHTMIESVADEMKPMFDKYNLALEENVSMVWYWDSDTKETKKRAGDTFYTLPVSEVFKIIGSAKKSFDIANRIYLQIKQAKESNKAEELNGKEKI